jgi:hypothetical protein
VGGSGVFDGRNVGVRLGRDVFVGRTVGVRVGMGVLVGRAVGVLVGMGVLLGRRVAVLVAVGPVTGIFNRWVAVGPGRVRVAVGVVVDVDETVGVRLIEGVMEGV